MRAGRLVSLDGSKPRRKIAAGRSLHQRKDTFPHPPAMPCIMKRWILLVLLPALASCHATAGRQVTWLETELIVSEPTVHARIFWFNRDWNVGECTLGAGSHVTLRRGGLNPDFTTGLGLSTTAGDGARLQYGITMLAADGTVLAHFPFDRDGREYVSSIPANVHIITGPSARISRDVYDRAARVLVHARCHSRSR